METFYGLRWYLTFMHHVGTVLLWAAWLAFLVLVPLCLLRRRAVAPDRLVRGMREYLAPLALVVLGASLLCLPGWRWLDGLLNEADIAVMGGVFQVRHDVREPGLMAEPGPAGRQADDGAKPGYPAAFVLPVNR